MLIAQMVNEFSDFYGRVKTIPCSFNSASGPSVESCKTFAKLHIIFQTNSFLHRNR